MRQLRIRKFRRSRRQSRRNKGMLYRASFPRLCVQNWKQLSNFRGNGEGKKKHARAKVRRTKKEKNRERSRKRRKKEKRIKEERKSREVGIRLSGPATWKVLPESKSLKDLINADVTF